MGLRKDIYADAERINKEAGFAYVDKPTIVCGSEGGITFSLETLTKLRAEGNDAWVSQYYGTWRETDPGAPARIKNPIPSQRNWTELSGWKDNRDVALLWVRVVMPPRPLQLKLNRDGIPLENQNPK